MLRNMDENKANMTRTLASIAALEADLDRVRPELLIIFTCSINSFMLLVAFYTPCKYHKTRGFLMISGDSERDQCEKMVLITRLKSSYS